MFLLRWLKKLFFLALFVLLVWWGAHYKVSGKSLYQRAREWIGSEDSSQGWKDIKMFVGGALKGLGEEIQEDVTEEDKKALEKMIQKKAKEKYGKDDF